MNQAMPVHKCPDSYTLFNPSTGKDIGGTYFGVIESAARAAFRNSSAVKKVAASAGTKKAVFWLRLRDRKRNTMTLYQVQVTQNTADSEHIKRFESFVKSSADCGRGKLTVKKTSLHTYKVAVLKGPIKIDAPSA